MASNSNKKKKEEEEEEEEDEEEEEEEGRGSIKGSKWYLWIPRPLRSAYRRLCPRLLRVFLRNRSRGEWSFLAL